MPRKLLIALSISIIAIICGILAAYYLGRGPDLKPYLALLEPRLSNKPDRLMLVVEARGDPNKVGPKAFALLFKTYHRIARARGPAFPRARWIGYLESPPEQWTGLYALPLPQGAMLDRNYSTPGFRVYVEEWKYGPVAEILHLGPYSQEGPTIERLKEFIQREGYRISGPHEEEYLRGPGMFGKGDPRKYYTIIRYQVEPAPVEKEPEKK